MTQSMESNSEKETWEIGNRIAQQCEAGTIVLLHGDLGVGKTVFTKGFAAGLGRGRTGEQSDLYDHTDL